MAGIELQGDANLTLVVDGTFTVTGGKAGERGKAYEVNASGFAGINVPVGTTLVVRGNGTVRAYGGDAGAGSEPYFWSRYDGTSSSLREIGGGAGGGGAGAGIGGNGGASGKGGGAVETGVVSSENGYHGGPGASAGSIYIYDAVTVYAYGGGGASGGRSGNGTFGDGGGGGGYPAAGVGGGGAGGGGGSNGSGGGGFSGGAGEASFTDANGGWQQYTPGGINGNIPAGGDRPQDRGSGGAYYGVGTLSTGSSTQKRGYIGGGGGPWGGLDRLNQHNGGNGGSAGNGGEVKQSSTAKVYAYNGSSTTTAGKQWETGKQTPIYWQNGHSLALGRTTATTKAQMESGSYFNADRLLSYENGLTHSRLGIGSGAGYTETSNGSYLFFFVRKFLTPAVTPFSVILKNQPRNC